jgi:hypothetical protein
MVSHSRDIIKGLGNGFVGKYDHPKSVSNSSPIRIASEGLGSVGYKAPSLPGDSTREYRCQCVVRHYEIAARDTFTANPSMGDSVEHSLYRLTGGLRDERSNLALYRNGNLKKILGLP